MAEIIQFPQRDLSWEGIEEWIVNVCKDAGLSPKMAHDVVQRYKPFHDSLFDLKKSEVKFPEELSLTQEQLDLIAPALRHTYINQMAHAAHIIIGLLARERRSEG